MRAGPFVCARLFPMWLRATLAILVLSLTPVSFWAASLCCGEVDACCQGESPECPVTPDGSCALVDAGNGKATLHAGPELLAPHAEAPLLTAPVFTQAFSSSPPSTRVSAYLLSRPLRN